LELKKNEDVSRRRARGTRTRKAPMSGGQVPGVQKKKNMGSRRVAPELKGRACRLKTPGGKKKGR